jgi:hypothetical protein
LSLLAAAVVVVVTADPVVVVQRSARIQVKVLLRDRPQPSRLVRAEQVVAGFRVVLKERTELQPQSQAR